MTLCAAGAIAFGALLLLLAYETRTDWTREIQPPCYSGDAKRGEQRVAEYGCTSCHEVGAASPRGRVGPPLTDVANRSYIAGRFANHEIWMTLWLEHPQALKPGTAMPDLGVTRRDARDIAAYLATLR